MKVSRTALRAAVDQALTAHRERHDAAMARWDKAVAEHRARWIETNADAWTAALPKIRAAVKRGEPITKAHLPQVGRYNDVALYSEPTSWIELPDETKLRKPPEEYAPPRELVMCARALDVLTDEEITTTGLHQLGITGSTLRDALAHLAAVSPEG